MNTRLNPFEIRAAAWTKNGANTAMIGGVLIPLKSGQLLGRDMIEIRPKGWSLNPFEIRAAAWTELSLKKDEEGQS